MGVDKVTFILTNAPKSPMLEEACYRVEVIDELTHDCMLHPLSRNTSEDVSMVLKHLQVTQFANVSEKIGEYREKLELIQTQICNDHFNTELHRQEQHCIVSLKKWLNIEESIYKQKSRIQWLQAGDSNSKVFFAAMKERQVRNTIDVLYLSTGAKLDQAANIQKELNQFYSNLMGRCVDKLHGI